MKNQVCVELTAMAHVGMNKTIASILILSCSCLIRAELVKFKCTMNDWNNEPKDVFNLTLGMETQRAIQTLKKGNLEMDLLVTDEYYELGQFTDATKAKDRFIPVIKLNKKTFNIDYAKYLDLVEPISCLKL